MRLILSATPADVAVGIIVATTGWWAGLVFQLLGNAPHNRVSGGSPGAPFALCVVERRHFVVFAELQARSELRRM